MLNKLNGTTPVRNVHRVPRPLSNGGSNIHYYHRHTRARLPGRPGSPEFLAAYWAAERDWATRKKSIVAAN